jgi:uncharacterized protein YerC
VSSPLGVRCKPFVLLQSTQETHGILHAALNPSKSEQLAHRWHTMALLATGSTCSQVRSTTSINHTTIGRTNRIIKYRSGVVDTFVDRLQSSSSPSQDQELFLSLLVSVSSVA